MDDHRRVPRTRALSALAAALAEIREARFASSAPPKHSMVSDRIGHGHPYASSALADGAALPHPPRRLCYLAYPRRRDRHARRRASQRDSHGRCGARGKRSRSRPPRLLAARAAPPLRHAKRTEIPEILFLHMQRESRDDRRPPSHTRNTSCAPTASSEHFARRWEFAGFGRGNLARAGRMLIPPRHAELHNAGSSRIPP